MSYCRLKQGWAFAWRLLMADELLVIIETRPALGSQLQFARELSGAAGLIALMIVVLAIGILVDSLVFAAIERGIRRRRGLVDAGV
jgi:NitT/TauT family transport system permease protein